MKFLIDMPLPPKLVAWLGQQGHDAVHALQIGLNRAPDEEILLRARHEGRVILTADLDYPRLLALGGVEGPGLILFRGGNYREDEIEERLGRAFETIPEADIARSIVVIEKSRIRRRRLPI